MFDYIRPETLRQAVSLLDDSTCKSRLLGGGTDVFVLLRYDKPDFDRLVDISLLPELKGIRQEGNTIIIGAAVTYAEAMESRLLQEKVPFLVEACSQIGGPQIQNHATLGGNLANAAPCADSLPVMACLDAVAHLCSAKGERKMLTSELVLGPNRTQIQPGEILSHLSFEIPPAGVTTAFMKIGRRNAQAISRLSMAAMGRMDVSGKVDYIHISPGAATPQTVRFHDAEKVLLGQKPDAELFTAAGKKVAETMIAVTGRRWSTDWKEPAIAALTERVLAQVFRGLL